MTRVKNRSMAHPDWPYVCDQYCKVQWYWSFENERHMPLPSVWNIKTQSGWVKATVHVGPPGYYPHKPDARELANMRMECPHAQADLTCNTCLRHVFRPVVL